MEAKSSHRKHSGSFAGFIFTVFYYLWKEKVRDFPLVIKVDSILGETKVYNNVSIQSSVMARKQKTKGSLKSL